MGDDGNNATPSHRSRHWIRNLLIASAILFVVLVVFHGPILRLIVRSVAVHYAAKENLKLSFQLEGDPLDQLTLHNIRATPTGPTAVQSLDVNIAKVDYSLTDLIFHGVSDALKDVELHDVVAVIDASKAPVPTPTPTPAKNKKLSLPAFFPDRLELTNINLTIKDKPQDMIVKNLNLGLYPNREGKLQIDKVQIPGVDTWTNVSAVTTYANKNLYLHNLTLDQNNQLQTVNIDASQIGQGKLGLELKGKVGGGDISTKTEFSAKGKSYQTNTQLHAQDISLGKLSKYLGQSAGQIAGDVKNADIDLQGKLDTPSSWNGTIKADVANVGEGKFKLDDVKLDLQAENGKATIREARIDQGNNHVQLRGSIDLPKKMKDFGRTPGSFQVSVAAPDLQQLTAFMPQPATGRMQANGNIRIENQTVHFDLNVNSDGIQVQGASIGKLAATVTAAKKMPAPNKKKSPPLYDGLTSHIQAQLEDVRYADYAVDRAQADVKSSGAKVSLESLTATDNSNVLQASGTFQLPPPNEKLLEQPTNLQFHLNAPQLSDYWRSDAPNKVTGEMEGDGSVRIRKGVANGKINLNGQSISIQRLLVRQMDLQATIAKNTVYLNDLTATLNAQDYIKAQGALNLQKPYHYSGSAVANLADLSTFQPLLNMIGTKPADSEEKTHLAGSLVLNWKGQGDAATFENRGDLALKLEHGRYADLQNLQADVQAHYTPQELTVPIVYLASDKLSFQAILQAKDSKLEISKIEIDQGQAKYASAYAAIPFTWSNLGSDKPLFPANGNVLITFQSENLDIAKLFRDLGAEPALTGELSLKLDARGPLDQLQANLTLQLQNLEAAAAKQLEPAKIGMAMQLQNNELTLLGKIEQAKIEPVQIDARMPLNVSRVLANGKLDEQTPVRAKVVMPRSSVNFVRQFVPALQQIDGTVALNMNVDGTIAKPALSGAADMSVTVARFENPTLPTLHDFNAHLSFRDNTLSFDRFGGDLAGGPFTVSGKITLPKLTAPNFDLHLKANSVLVARNDNLTARADADIRVEGPMKSATVSGQVLTTNSRFFKNIDIIPITLPGRPAPHPEPPSAAPELSFPDPPLRDWKFDITIKSKDPFLIRGNLAAGKAIIDMKLSGTGLHPGLQGQVRLENFDATLPFSTLSINLGFLYFTADDPFNPHVELQGTSLIRDYTIHVYVYGTATDPQAIFSSEPPLPQEEIISLLATGTTREELAQKNVLASRAAVLLVKQLYRKIFKKGAEPERNDNSFFSRLDVEFGNTDPRTGEQTATARYKASEHIVLIGDLGVQGGFRGLVKYVIRFR